MKTPYALAILIAAGTSLFSTMPTIAGEPDLRTATFAGGCFWCTEADFEKVPGVTGVVSGYTGGHVENPTYEAVSAGGTGHVEVAQVTYDPARVTYRDLLDVFWHHVDPTDPGGQFVDRGSPYRSAIFYHNEDQKRLAEASRDELERTGPFEKPIVAEILPLGTFYPAEAYHQDYYKTHPVRYRYYRWNSGRDQFLEKTWKDFVEKPMQETPGKAYPKPSDHELQRLLTPLQYQVTRKNGTEPPFDNAYWNNKKAGIYVDVISGEPLFSSLDKYESGTGWPSFSQPLVSDNVLEREDRKFFVKRVEVRSRHGDSHLGHVFSDGPAPTGLRYCINSASLRFVPAENLTSEGYEQFQPLFTQGR